MEVSVTLPDGNTVRIQQPEGYVITSHGIYEHSVHPDNRICDLIWSEEVDPTDRTVSRRR